MLWIRDSRNGIRVIALVLFIVAMLGPWMYDLIHVPAEYACSAPNVRLEGDFCGLPMSGMKTLPWFVLGFFGMITRLFTAYTDGYSPGLLEYVRALFFVIPILPLIGSLLVVVKQKSQALQRINRIFWILACVSTLPWLYSDPGAQAGRLWGLWAYIGLTFVMTLVEVLVLKEKSPRQI